MRRLSRRHVLSVILWFAFSAASLLAADVVLVWDANTEPTLAGYKVYSGNASGAYGAPLVIGTQTTYTFTNVAPGTWYFAVKAYDTDGLESDYSNEVSVTINAPALSRCDINTDSSTNVLDLQALVNVILGTRTAAPGNDLNTDGRVDVIDLQVLNNVILGVRTCP